MLINPLSLASPPLFRAADIHAIDRQWTAAHADASLMERAGASAAELALMLASETGEPILVLVGPGNNGGDALVAARLLAAQGIPLLVVSRADPARLPADAAHAWEIWRQGGGKIHPDIPAGQRFGLIIDGLFGVGLVRDVGGEEARWIELANTLPCPRLALDIPSGLDSDSGRVRGIALRADHTLTYLGLKPGLLTADGPDCCGQLHLDRLGIDPTNLPAAPGFALTQLQARHTLPPRRNNSHKGEFGHVGIIGGAPGMVGAALIAGRAALRQGAGSVTLGVLDERVVVDPFEPRLMFGVPEALLQGRLDVLAIGPGMGLSARANELLQQALAVPCPLLLDADALNLLAAHAELAKLAAQRSHPTLLTPHPGEAARLLGTRSAEIQQDRIGAALELSRQFCAQVALKGAGTVVASPAGRYAINTTGGPWLAQAGSGDRLSGMVAALLGQGMQADDALQAAVWLHGSAALD